MSYCEVMFLSACVYQANRRPLIFAGGLAEDFRRGCDWWIVRCLKLAVQNVLHKQCKLPTHMNEYVYIYIQIALRQLKYNLGKSTLKE